MFEIRITQRTDGQEKVIEISDRDVASAFAATEPATQRFTDNGDGTVTDTKLGLMWSQATLGEMDHEAAQKACAELTLGGHTDWRLPEVEELFGLADRSRHSPAIDAEAFPDTKSDWYWSSTPAAWNASCAWFVLFSSGNCYYLPRGAKAFVRAVRVAGQ